MQPLLWTLLCLVAYAGGLVIILKMTPMLFAYEYYEGMFLGVAAADIVGGMLAFGAMVITFGLFSGAFGIRVLDFALLVGIFIVGVSMVRRCLHPRVMNTHLPSRISAGIYCGLLALIAIVSIVLLFIPNP
ncbi:MAG TPA: hypothetical protein VFQ30_20190, partial [Ktedonobacteraceae bacterium]|nr:hypothetical protein [Ktedonobacteraceae bacterium]